MITFIQQLTFVSFLKVALKTRQSLIVVWENGFFVNHIILNDGSVSITKFHVLINIGIFLILGALICLDEKQIVFCLSFQCTSYNFSRYNLICVFFMVMLWTFWLVHYLINIIYDNTGITKCICASKIEIAIL